MIASAPCGRRLSPLHLAIPAALLANLGFAQVIPIADAAQARPVAGMAMTSPAANLPLSRATAASIASGIGGYFRSAAPDMTRLKAPLAALEHLNYFDPAARASVAPVVRAVRTAAARVLGEKIPIDAAGALAHAEKVEALDRFFRPYTTARQGADIHARSAALAFRFNSAASAGADDAGSSLAEKHRAMLHRAQEMADEIYPLPSSGPDAAARGNSRLLRLPSLTKSGRARLILQ